MGVRKREKERGGTEGGRERESEWIKESESKREWMRPEKILQTEWP